MIAIYTTFLRPKLVERTLSSYLKFFDGKILVLDQGMGEDNVEKLCKDKGIFYYPLSFDCGLSQARNIGVGIAKMLKEDYFLLAADSIKLTEKLDLGNIVSFLKSSSDYAVAGLELKNRVPWNLDMKKNNGWLFDIPRREKISFRGIDFQPCDIVKNFSVGKTEVFTQIPWDYNLKIGEHSDTFWRLKEADYKVFYTKVFSAEYINYKPPEYNKYRARMYDTFMQKIKNKYGFTGSYFQYTPELQEYFRKWREKNR